MKNVIGNVKKFLFEEDGDQYNKQYPEMPVPEASVKTNGEEAENSANLKTATSYGPKNSNPNCRYFKVTDMKEMEYACELVYNGYRLAMSVTETKDEQVKRDIINYLKGFCQGRNICLEEFELNNLFMVDPDYPLRNEK
ncbi:hypothetical protein [Bacillus bombysepticus]|uniref:hypothetical protein n=1 Tax=Bacillus bombysepticus TaxID=658666 RepID=UPI00301961C5